MDSDSRMLRNVVITLGACWVYVGCVWVACAFTGASFPGVASLVRIVSLPAVTLVVSVVLFVALVGGVVWAWWSWVPGGVAGGGGPQDSFKDMHQKQAVAKARRILSDALLGETSSASDQSLVRLIGSLRGKRLYAQQEDSELVVSQTRGGKTRSIVARRVIEAPGAVVATSTKADGVYLTWRARQVAAPGSQIFSFDPLSVATGPVRVRWNPVAGCDDFDVARRRGAALALGSTKAMGEGNSRWFAERGAQILGYLFHAAALGDRTIADIQAWVSDPREAVAILERAKGPTTVRMAGALNDLMVEMAPETAAGFIGTIQGALEPLMIPAVYDMLTPSVEDSFDVEAFISSRDTLWVLSPDSEGALAAITTMFVNDIYEVARALSARKPGGRHVPAISFILDEAANIAPLPNMGSMFSEGAGRGLFMCAIFQDVHQMEARWGAIQAKTIFQQARLTYIMGSSKDPEWNEQIAALSREFEAKRSSVSTSNQGRSISTHTEHRHALRASDIQNIAIGRAVFLAPGHEATVIDLPDIAEDPTWGSLVKEGTSIYNEYLASEVADDVEWMRMTW